MKNCFGASRSPEGAPQRAASPIYNAPCDGQINCSFTEGEGPGRHNPLQTCSRSVLRPSAGSKEPRLNFLPSLEAPRVPAKAPGKSFENQRWSPKWSLARITAFSKCPVTTSMRGEKLSKQKINLGTCLKKNVFKFEVDRRLESLHFKGGS